MVELAICDRLNRADEKSTLNCVARSADLPDDVAVLTEVRDSVFVVSLNDEARRNALTADIRTGLGEALARFRADAGLRAMVITGSGTAFCSGADLGPLLDGTMPTLVDMTESPAREGWITGFDFPLLFWELNKPTIAALNGPAIGAGFGLALACDMRVASTAASGATGFVHLALSAEYGLSHQLPRLCGPALAHELMLTGRRVDAAELLDLRLVNRVVEPEALMDTAFELAGAIAGMAPPAVAHIKQALRRSAEAQPFRAQIEYEAYLQSLSFATDEHAEALRRVGSRVRR
jgi:2-(1,2-epoxy-1,2-dihydrophenyl)acetyl-CoA isomerase